MTKDLNLVQIITALVVESQVVVFVNFVLYTVFNLPVG